MTHMLHRYLWWDQISHDHAMWAVARARSSEERGRGVLVCATLADASCGGAVAVHVLLTEIVSAPRPWCCFSAE